MICPVCRAEYREGFTRCADCGVDLVEVSAAALVAPHHGRADDGGEQEDPFCEFWRGDDPRLQSELCQVLEEVGIPIRTLQMNDQLMVGIASKRAIFRIGVRFSMFEKAEKAVAEAYGGVDEGPAPMYPTEENRPEFRKLIEMPLEEKLKATEEELPTFQAQVTWKCKPKKDEVEQKE